MGSGNDGFNYNDPKSDPRPPQQKLEGDAKVLQEAYLTFSKNGLTHDEKQKLSKIDEVLADASIQVLKNGEAVITDLNGKSTHIRPR